MRRRLTASIFPRRESEHDVIKVPVSLLFLGIIGTLLGLFVGIPLRYPQLSNLPARGPAPRHPYPPHLAARTASGDFLLRANLTDPL